MKTIKIKTLKTYQSIKFAKKEYDYFNKASRGLDNISMVLHENFIHLRDHKTDEVVLISVTNAAYMVPYKQEELDNEDKLRADFEREIAAIKAQHELERQEYERKLEEVSMIEEPAEEVVEDLFTKVDASDDDITDEVQD